MMYRKIRFALTQEQYNRLKLVSITEGLPMTHIIRGALDSYLEGLEVGEVDSEAVNTQIQANIQEKEDVTLGFARPEITCTGGPSRTIQPQHLRAK